MPSFPDEVLEHVLVFLTSSKDRNAVSLVCKAWYRAEAWGRRSVFIGNIYAVSPEIVVRRFPRIRSLTLKGKPRFADFNLVPPNWGADVLPWLLIISSAYPMLEELRLKRMTVTDESLELLAHSFPNFRALSLTSCDGFSTDGLAIIASDCRNCKNLQRLAVSGWLTDETFEYIGLYAKNLETLSVAFAGNSDRGMQYVLQGCPKLRKLEIRDSPFGDAALLSGLDHYESMRSLWMSACKVTMNGCKILAQEMPRLNVEIIKENDDNDMQVEKLYVYRSVSGPRKDAPNFVYTL